MSPKEYRKTLLRYRGQMAIDPQIDDVTYDAYTWWMNQQFEEMSLEMKKAALGGRLSLRIRLKNLIALILTHNGANVKEVSHGSIK